MLKELAHEFARDSIRPMAEHWDENSEFPMEAIAEAHELGLMNLHIPEEYGGMGFGCLTEAIVQERLAWGDPGFATAAYSNGLTAAPIITGGTEEQKQKYLGWLVEKPSIAAYAVTEPGAGSDVAAIQSTAVRDGDDYILNGNKMWITGAGKADWYFVLAYTDKDAGYKGMSGFIVEADWDGVSLGKKENNMGQRASDTRAVNFENVRVPAANLVGGKEGAGWFNAMAAFDVSRPSVAAHAIGISQAAYEHALQYADERVTFGKKLHQHQTIQFMLADMATELEAARALLYLAAAKVTDNAPDKSRFSAMAKRLATDSGSNVVNNALQLFGGYGYLKEYPIERFWRDLRVHSILEGTNQVMRMIVGRDLLRQ